MGAVALACTPIALAVACLKPVKFSRTLHALRGLAALAVMLFHWEQFFPAVGYAVQQYVPTNTLLDPTVYIGFGWMGVPLFSSFPGGC